LTSALTFNRALEQRYLQPLLRGDAVSQSLTAEFFQAVAQGEIDPIVLASALTALKLRGEQPADLTGAAMAFRQQATQFPRLSKPTIDCCGTGGDGSNTINISTTAAIVAASMGLTVAKHGNRSVSSQSGSADLFEQLGVQLQMTPDQAAQALEQANLAFLFAPVYHPGVRFAMPVRQALKTRTLFNVLGPLLNPTAPRFQLLGVYDRELLELMATSLLRLGVQRGWVVHGVSDGQGCDEIVLGGTTYVAEIADGQIRYLSLTAADFGLPAVPLSALAGGSPADNATATRAILAGSAPMAHQYAIAANVAAMLQISGRAGSLPDLCQEVLAHLASGQADSALVQLRTVQQSFGATVHG